jgi:hypothetical protein
MLKLSSNFGYFDNQIATNVGDDVAFILWILKGLHRSL